MIYDAVNTGQYVISDTRTKFDNRRNLLESFLELRDLAILDLVSWNLLDAAEQATFLK
jgi:hypothetical protein